MHTDLLTEHSNCCSKIIIKSSLRKRSAAPNTSFYPQREVVVTSDMHSSKFSLQVNGIHKKTTAS